MYTDMYMHVRICVNTIECMSPVAPSVCSSLLHVMAEGDLLGFLWFDVQNPFTFSSSQTLHDVMLL